MSGIPLRAFKTANRFQAVLKPPKGRRPKGSRAAANFSQVFDKFSLHTL